MLGFVAVDCDVPESGSREMCLQFIGGVGVHTLDHLLPFLVIAGEAIAAWEPPFMFPRGIHGYSFP